MSASGRPSKKVLEIQERLREQQLRRLKALELGINSPGPTKKKAKGSSQKLQNTFEKNLRGVPGTSMSRFAAGSIVSQIAAARTGTKVRRESIGLLRSARNANTTSGSYVTTWVEDEQGYLASDPQGRKEFGL